jgi:hypothetical protein
MGQKWYQSKAYDLGLGCLGFILDFNPLTAGIGQIGPGLFLNCPYKKPVILKI